MPTLRLDTKKKNEWLDQVQKITILQLHTNYRCSCQGPVTLVDLDSQFGKMAQLTLKKKFLGHLKCASYLVTFELTVCSLPREHQCCVIALMLWERLQHASVSESHVNAPILLAIDEVRRYYLIDDYIHKMVPENDVTSIFALRSHDRLSKSLLCVLEQEF